MIDNVLDLSGKTSVGELVTKYCEYGYIDNDRFGSHAYCGGSKTAFIALLGLSTSPTSTILPREPNGCILED